MKNLIYSTLVMAMFITSCSKDENSPFSNSNSVPLIKSLRTLTPRDTFTISLTYDPQGRVIQKIATYESRPEKKQTFMYEYAGSQVIARENDANGILKNTTYGNLNSNSLIDSSIEDNGERFRKYFHDTDMHLIEVKEYDQNNILTGGQISKYENGNLIFEIHTDELGNQVFSLEYSNYDLTKKNSLAYVNVGQPYYGKESNNTFRTVVYHSNSITVELINDHTYDSFGRVTKRVTYELGSPKSAQEEYITYY